MVNAIGNTKTMSISLNGTHHNHCVSVKTVLFLFPQISLFALNVTKVEHILLQEHPANAVLNGTLAVDLACQKEAQLSGLPGTYVALVSSPRRSLKQLLQYQYRDSMPVVNTKVHMCTVCMLGALELSLSPDT